jgi:superfamily I DNA/RNA helicase
MTGREDQILILISSRRLQLDLITNALQALRLPFDPPNGLGLVDDFEAFRAVYSMLRILRDITSGEEDYPAYRDLLDLLSGVGQRTAKGIGDACITNNQNFRALFHLATPPQWLGRRGVAAVQRIIACVQGVAGWTLADTLSSRANDIETLLLTHVLNASAHVATHRQAWNALVSALPGQMTLDELLAFLAADTYAVQQDILNAVNQRIGGGQQQQPSPPVAKKIRILTMHGAKGLTGSVVFIPSAEQGIMPNQKALQATGLLIEQRRVFYVSVTRAKACCIISHTGTRTGFQAQSVFGSGIAHPTRSQFLNEMGIPTVQRTGGLTQGEAQSIVSEVNNL